MKRRCAFTLLELLVVIAVVSITAAILFGAIRNSMLKAASVGCVSNLRTLAAAYQFYIADNNGEPLRATYTTAHSLSEGHNGPGIRLLRFYYRDGLHKVWNNGTFIQEATELCPSVRYNGMSGALNIDNGPDYALSHHTPANINATAFYTDPARTPIIWDGWNGGWKTENTMPLRHNGGINAAFLDGHVEWIGADDGRLYRTWWYYATNRAQPDDNQLFRGAPLGATEL